MTRSMLFVLGVFLFFLAVSCSGKVTITANGASTALPVMQQIGKRFERLAPGYRFSFQGDGSSAGEKAVVADVSEFATIARPVSPDAANDLIVVPWLEDDIVFIVGTAVEIESLTMAELRGIFDTRYAKQRPSRLVRVGKSPAHGTFQATADAIGVPAEFFASDVTVGPNAEAIHVVSTLPEAIGYVSGPVARAAIASGAPIRTIAIDGLSPTRKALLDGSYPLRRTISLIVKADRSISVGARMFLALATGAEGRDIARRVGFRPIQTAAAAIASLDGHAHDTGARP